MYFDEILFKKHEEAKYNRIIIILTFQYGKMIFLLSSIMIF